MLDEATVRYLESGCAQLVGTVSSSGRPHAARAWGMRVIDPAEGQIRLVLDSADARTLENVAEGGRIAVTTANVPSLFSIQLKGRVERLEPTTPEDEAVVERYCAEFFRDIHEVDHFPMSQLELWGGGRRFVACVLRAEQVFDQSPGPAAGSAFTRGAAEQRA